jgi:hypothetical protein
VAGGPGGAEIELGTPNVSLPSAVRQLHHKRWGLELGYNDPPGKRPTAK